MGWILGETGKSVGRGNHNLDILCAKNLFSVKEKKSKQIKYQSKSHPMDEVYFDRGIGKLISVNKNKIWKSSNKFVWI